MFFISGALLGVGLATDAFSVSIANGLAEPQMKMSKALLISFVFAAFQAAMPLVGRFFVHGVSARFSVVKRLVPLMSLVFLSLIGSNMIFEGVWGVGCPAREKREKKTKDKTENKTKEREEIGDGEKSERKLGAAAIFLQGIATSVDALSVGFTIEHYDAERALLCAAIIAVVTFLLCVLGSAVGKKFGSKYSKRAKIAGGIILIAIGVKIYIG